MRLAVGSYDRDDAILSLSPDNIIHALSSGIAISALCLFLFLLNKLVWPYKSSRFIYALSFCLVTIMFIGQTILWAAIASV